MTFETALASYGPMGVIIAALCGVIIHLYMDNQKLQAARLADAIEAGKKSEARETRVTEVVSSLSQTTGLMYKKIIAAQKSRGKL